MTDDEHKMDIQDDDFAAVDTSTPDYEYHWECQWEKDCQYFVNVLLPSVAVVRVGTNGEKIREYFMGAISDRAIDVMEFYRRHGKQMPLLITVILQILSHRADSACNERIFSIAKLVISDVRTSLTPERSEKLILSACRYKMSQSSKLTRPKLINEPGEPFENDEDIINQMDDVAETLVSSGNCTTSSAGCLQEDVAARWGEEMDNHTTNNYFSDSDEDM